VIESLPYPDHAGFTLKLTHLNRSLSIAWQLILILACAGFILSFVYLVFANYWPGPYEDYWADMPLIESLYNGTISFHQLIIAHNNSHRILIPRLLFLADYQFASGTNTLLITAAFLFKLALMVLFNRLLVTRNLAERLLFNTLIIMVIFNSALVYNTVFNINIQWDMMLLFSLSAIACFYRYCHTRPHSMVYFMLAYLLFFCAALTHAGGFFCLPVFWLIAIREKKYRDQFLPVGLFITLFYLTFYVLPVSHPDAPTYQMMIIDMATITGRVFGHFFQLLSAGIYREHTIAYIYFSFFVLALIIFNIVAHRKIKHGEGSFWAYASLFMLIVMFIVSSSRVGWLWTASADLPRFKVLSLFLLLTLTLHCLVIIRHMMNPLLASGIRCFVIANSAALILMVQQLNFTLNFSTSNNNFATHAIMLLKGANRETGRWLGRNILYREDRDILAHMDAIFQSRGLAYYDNKVIQTDNGRLLYKTGDALLATNQLSSFTQGCSPNTSVIETRSDEGIVAIFSTLIDPKTHNILLTSINRDSYFVLDENGIITGYAYIYVDTETNNVRTFIRGVSNTSNIHYVAEISSNQPKCLYQITH